MDTRAGLDARVRPVDGVSTVSGGPNIATGTFIADSATQVISIGNTSDGGQLNMLQLRRLPIVVSNTNDTGAGSLRAALTAAANASGPDVITFAPALSGQSITPTKVVDGVNGDTCFTVSDTAGVTVDATALAGGLTVAGGGAAGNYRLFRVANGGSLTLRGLTLAGAGYGIGTGGGAIRNDGTLALERCTLSGNASGGNGVGGAIYNGGTLTLTQCTLSDNSTGGGGGAIYNGGTLTLTQCTLSGNSATAGGDGGAISNFSTLTLTNSIVAANTAAGIRDIWNPGPSPTTTGMNLIKDLAGSGLSAGATVIVGAPNLGPLANYGGPTATRPPLPGSPAIDAAGATSTFLTDQRGTSFPRVVDGDGNGTASVDIGAVETQVPANLSFETPVLSAGGYTGAIPGWTDTTAGGDINNRFIEHITGFAAQGNQHLGMESGRAVVRDLDASYLPGTVYRLRVAAGNRAGWTGAGNASTITLTDPTGAATASGVSDASTIPAGSFAEMPALFVDTTVTSALVGQRIRVQLTAAGAGRSHFDNVRLDRVFLVTTTADTGPGSLRQAVTDAAANPGADTIAFGAPLVAGQCHRPHDEPHRGGCGRRHLG